MLGHGAQPGSLSLDWSRGGAHGPWRSDRGLAVDLIGILRGAPSGRLLNAVEHMWARSERGYPPTIWWRQELSPGALLAYQRLALRHRERFLLSSVALSELAVFLDVEK